MVKMVKLTEEMVIARSKQSTLSSITKLNCWGNQLTDVTIVRRMPNVTVISLSVNSISSLVDFQYCERLQDLFVRKNNIRDLNQVCYLKDLVCLKSLYLDENPCVVHSLDDEYRLSVIRALPQLQKLDETQVDPSEAERSQRLGKVLIHPEQQEEYYSDSDAESPDEEKETDVVNNAVPTQGWQEPEQQFAGSEPDQESSPEPPQATILYRPVKRAPSTLNENDEETTVSYQDNGSPKQTPEIVETEQLTRSSSFKSEESVGVYPSAANMRNNQHYNSMPRSRTTDGELGYCQEYNRRYTRSSCTNNCGGRRPAERKTNILNAVLCLIKELDYHNLEVVEMAVKCRMDELDG